MTDRHTVDSLTSDALDQLYDDLNRVREHLIATAARPLPVGYDDADRAVRDYARDLLAVLDAEQPERTTPDNPLAERIRTLIESEMYEYRERSMWWPETGGITEEIARLATRGALEALGLPVPAQPREETADAADEGDDLTGQLAS